MRYSYSRIAKYNQCPQAFFRQYILNEVPYTSSPEAEYGSRCHDFIDHHMKGKADFTSDTEFLRPLLTKLKSIKGRIETEYGLGFREDRSQTTFDDKEAFVIGKSDCTIFHPSEPRAMVKDWKFARVKPENYVVEINMFVLLHFWAHPELEQIDTELVWLKYPAPSTRKIYTKEDLPVVESAIMKNIEAIEESISFEKFPCKPSGICYGWCGAKLCKHYKPKKEK